MDDPSELVTHLKHVWRVGPIQERENVVYGIARYVSKMADLSVSDAELTALRQFLTVDECVELYIQIRDLSRRPEDEWRDQFIRYFPYAEIALPEMIV